MKSLAAAAVAALALAVTPGAGASTVSASLGPFSYSLVDLDPDDGITPSVSLVEGNSAGLYTSVSASTQYSYDWMSGGFYSMPGFASDAPGASARLLLSPATALTLTSRYSESWSSGNDRLTGQYFFMMIASDNGESGLFEQAMAWDDVVDLAPHRSGTRTGTFNLFLANGDSTAMDLSVQLQMQASVIANPAISAVPEPDSLALGATAALLAPLLRRRRMARSAQA